MDIRFVGKHIMVTEGMKEHLREKLPKLEKYCPRLVESHVVLKKEKYLYEAEITLLAKNLRAYGDGSHKGSIYTAIDRAYDRVEKQLKKFREKIKDHHKKHGERAVPLKVKAAQKIMGDSELAERRPEVIRTQSFAVKPMSVEEASLQIELGRESFLVFLNAVTRRVNVIYKREDGNHGLIEPEF